MPGGKSDLTTAIEQARSILKNGKNPKQQILLLTDDQLTNWQSLNALMSSDRGPDALLGPDDEADHSPVSQNEQKGGLFAKIINLPEKTDNLAVNRRRNRRSSVASGGKKPSWKSRSLMAGRTQVKRLRLSFTATIYFFNRSTVEPLAQGLAAQFPPRSNGRTQDLLRCELA